MHGALGWHANVPENQVKDENEFEAARIQYRRMEDPSVKVQTYRKHQIVSRVPVSCYLVD